jgi:hypothetical protein
VSAEFYPQKDLLVLISVRGWVYPRAIVRLEGLGKLKQFNDLVGLKPVTFQPVAYCLNYLHYRRVLSIGPD